MVSVNMCKRQLIFVPGESGLQPAHTTLFRETISPMSDQSAFQSVLFFVPTERTNELSKEDRTRTDYSPLFQVDPVLVYIYTQSIPTNVVLGHTHLLNFFPDPKKNQFTAKTTKMREWDVRAILQLE